MACLCHTWEARARDSGPGTMRLELMLATDGDELAVLAALAVGRLRLMLLEGRLELLSPVGAAASTQSPLGSPSLGPFKLLLRFLSVAQSCLLPTIKSTCSSSCFCSGLHQAGLRACNLLLEYQI